MAEKIFQLKLETGSATFYISIGLLGDQATIYEGQYLGQGHFDHITETRTDRAGAEATWEQGLNRGFHPITDPIK